MPQRMLRRSEVEARTGLSRSTIYKLMADGGFPRPARLTPGAVRWPEAAINAWLADRSGEAT